MRYIIIMCEFRIYGIFNLFDLWDLKLLFDYGAIDKYNELNPQ